MNFGAKVRKFRNSNKWSQTVLSSKTNIPQTTISDIENGRSLPDIRQAINIAKALGIQLTELLEDDEEQTA